MKSSRTLRLVGSLATGALSGASLAQAELWPAASFLAPLALTLLSAVALRSTLRMTLACGAAAGMFFWYGLLGWASVAGGAVIPGMDLAAGTIAALESFYFVAWMTLVVLTRQHPFALAAALAGVVWAGGEIARTFGTWAMPYGEIGASQSASLAGTGLGMVGTTGLTVAIVAGAYAVARYALRAANRRSYAGTLFFGTMLVGACVTLPSNADRRTVAAPPSLQVVQASAVDRSGLRALLGMVRAEIAGRTTDAILFPEGALTPALAHEDVAWVNDWVRQTGVPVVAGAMLHVGSRYANAVILFSGHGEPKRYFKQKLVPFGEFVPGKPLFTKVVVLPNGDMLRGHNTAVWQLPRIKVSPLICFEIGFGRLALSGVRDGAAVLIVALNDAWFSSAEGVSLQYAVARARARSLGTDVVIAAVRGPSAVFHADGSATFAARSDGPLVWLPVKPQRTTVYSSIGDIPFAACVFGVGAFYLAGWRTRRGRLSRALRSACSSRGVSNS
jgi:apolipoprotein N-acyltransferase